MDNKGNIFILVILVMILGLAPVSAQEPNAFTRPTSVAFKGESPNWIVEHRLYLVGTDVDYETKITYRGEDQTIIGSPSLRYTIDDQEGGYITDTFSLNKAHLFQSKRLACYGCKYLDKKKEITVTIGEWEDYEEKIVLKALKK
ncbi:hypothetical protein [Halalkalibacter krulwichiae]|uniref:Uncharacterized protein n=1 Tax=Halalkalibacter krulwichiae TaxID=199441 RepID=A0A1X9MFS6_9BACI|nr:hypothetical protein [Halalkalibacter krulwichiae]ARK32266.1 hypothetical protein BkAM31D_21745 [Halalkalibacter krulwichiae]